MNLFFFVYNAIISVLCNIKFLTVDQVNVLVWLD